VKGHSRTRFRAHYDEGSAILVEGFTLEEARNAAVETLVSGRTPSVEQLALWIEKGPAKILCLKKSRALIAEFIRDLQRKEFGRPPGARRAAPFTPVEKWLAVAVWTVRFARADWCRINRRKAVPSRVTRGMIAKVKADILRSAGPSLDEAQVYAKIEKARPLLIGSKEIRELFSTIDCDIGELARAFPR
jgi:hypothetical protein